MSILLNKVVKKEGGKSLEGNIGKEAPLTGGIPEIPHDPKPLPIVKRARSKKTNTINNYEKFILHNLDMLKEALDESIKQYQNKPNSKSKRRVVRYKEIYDKLIKIEVIIE